MAGEALGLIACGCGQTAAIKKLKNSELLYSHCTKCGCDRRTGEHFQAQFRAAVGVWAIPENPENISGNEQAAMPETAKAGREWEPTPQTHGRQLPENSGDEQDDKPGISGKGLAAGALFFLAGLGFITRMMKG